ncbi:MAG TPA: hypothetical protein VET30_01205, partial [Pseudoxanthomonas sp.]|nr:hypothetical protein [Pseudoxanthomonas sp.]
DQDVTPSWVAAISAARSVRYRLCRDEYTLTPRDINAFGIIAAKLKSAVLASPVPQAGAPAAPAAREVEYKGMNWRPKHAQSLFPSRD